MTITMGWWAAPAAITLAAFVWVWWPERQTGYGVDIVGALKLLVAIIVMLTAWLVWALATR